jgi:D-alanyl-D-alanine carboxypeptidase (penicillin-binding protein 5/6)
MKKLKSITFTRTCSPWKTIFYGICFFFVGSAVIFGASGLVLSVSPSHLRHEKGVIDEGEGARTSMVVAPLVRAPVSHVATLEAPRSVVSEWHLIQPVQVLPMASITKLMTAFVVLDRATMDTMITVSARAAATPPTNLPLGSGEQLTVRELMSALLLPSANDAANALADGLGGETSFVAAMNMKARTLGLNRTHFVDVTGFDAPGHVSSAADLAQLAHDLFLAHPELLALTNQPRIILNATATHKEYDLQNFHPLVGKYPGYAGGKPGYTGDAGYCLLTVAQRGDASIITVVLNSPDYAGESVKLLDEGFRRLGK